MKEPIGKKIQDLEKTVVNNIKMSELAEHPRIYHGSLKDPREPLALLYKVPEIYRQGKNTLYDPLFDNIPLKQIMDTAFPGVLEVKTSYDENTQEHRVQLSLETRSVEDVLGFKYEVLEKLNQAILQYLKKQHAKHGHKEKRTKEK